jgi:hypothetical protein
MMMAVRVQLVEFFLLQAGVPSTGDESATVFTNIPATAGA